MSHSYEHSWKTLYRPRCSARSSNDCFLLISFISHWVPHVHQKSIKSRCTYVSETERKRERLSSSVGSVFSLTISHLYLCHVPCSFVKIIRLQVGLGVLWGTTCVASDESFFRLVSGLVDRPNDTHPNQTHSGFPFVTRSLLFGL